MVKWCVVELAIFNRCVLFFTGEISQLQGSNAEECRVLKRPMEAVDLAKCNESRHKRHHGEMLVTKVNNMSNSLQTLMGTLDKTRNLPITDKSEDLCSTASKHGVFSIADADLDDDDLELNLT